MYRLMMVFPASRSIPRSKLGPGARYPSGKSYRHRHSSWPSNTSQHARGERVSDIGNRANNLLVHFNRRSAGCIYTVLYEGWRFSGLDERNPATSEHGLCVVSYIMTDNR